METDAPDIGFGGILKQVQNNKKGIIQFVSKHWNECQMNYSTIKKEILAIVLTIYNFQGDLLNQNFF